MFLAKKVDILIHTYILFVSTERKARTEFNLTERPTRTVESVSTVLVSNDSYV
jgi:hypothetical protein